MARTWPPPLAATPTVATSLVTFLLCAMVVPIFHLSWDALGAWLSIGLVTAAIAAPIARARYRRRRALGEGPQAGWTGPRDAITCSFASSSVPGWVHLALGIAGGQSAGRIVWEAVEDGRWSTVAGLGSGVFVVAAGGLVAQRVFRGSPQVKFDRFPYRTGERARFWIAMMPGSPRLEDGAALLRCVTGTEETDARLLWGNQHLFPPDEGPGPDEFVAAEYDPPGDVPGTAAAGTPPVRWELVIGGRTRWGRVMEVFVVPVYAPEPSPAGGPGAARPTEG